MRLKSDTKVALKQWIAVRENEVGKRVKVMRSDNGGVVPYIIVSHSHV